MARYTQSEQMMKDKKITIELNPKLHSILKQLHARGLHGLTIEETALRLIEEELRKRVRPEDQFIRIR